MIVVGAGGHALEILQILTENAELSACIFFDDTSREIKSPFFESVRVIRSLAEAEAELSTDRRVVLAVGGPAVRRSLAEAFLRRGGTLQEIRASTATVGTHSVDLGAGINFMHHVFLSNRVSVGDGSLLNTGCQVHHGVKVGRFAEIGPSAVLLGDADIGDEVAVGANATVLSGVRVGARSTVGAGAVVTKDVPPGSTVMGVPARHAT